MVQSADSFVTETRFGSLYGWIEILAASVGDGEWFFSRPCLTENK